MRALWGLAVLLLIVGAAEAGTLAVRKDGAAVVAEEAPDEAGEFAPALSSHAMARRTLGHVPALPAEEPFASWRLEASRASARISLSQVAVNAAGEAHEQALPSQVAAPFRASYSPREGHGIAASAGKAVLMAAAGMGPGLVGQANAAGGEGRDLMVRAWAPVEQRLGPHCGGESGLCREVAGFGSDTALAEGLLQTYALGQLAPFVELGSSALPSDVRLAEPSDVVVDVDPQLPTQGSRPFQAGHNELLWDVAEGMPDVAIAADVADLGIAWVPDPMTSSPTVARPEHGAAGTLHSAAMDSAAGSLEAALPSIRMAESSDPRTPEESSYELPKALRSADAGTTGSPLLPGALLPWIALGASLALPLWALYRRIHPGEALGNANRSQLYDLVVASPGMSAADLQSRTGLHYTTCRHHLRILQNLGYVRATADGRVTRYVPSSSGPVETRAISAVQNATARAVLARVAAAPGGSIAEVAREAGITRALAKYHVDKLERAQLVETRLDGTLRRVRLQPLAAEAIVRTLAYPSPGRESAP